jgi:hypothetical protein
MSNFHHPFPPEQIESFLLHWTRQWSVTSVWLSLCLVILIAYGTHAPKAMDFNNPTITIESSRYGDAFVDDTTIGLDKERTSISIKVKNSFKNVL